jgi:GMP synthase (glutamine-hydrolysing)
VTCEPPNRIADALEAAGVEVRVVAIHAEEPIPATPASGLVIMGGPMGVYESDRYPHLLQERALIERAIAAKTPVLGICLGSQLLASALGARVYASGSKEIGWAPVALEPSALDDPLLHGLASGFQALHWHGDVFDLPKGAVHLARSQRTAHQAFRYGEHAYGLLFHLEVSVEQSERMAITFADELSGAGVDPVALVADSRRYAAETERLAARVFGRFARRVLGALGRGSPSSDLS